MTEREFVLVTNKTLLVSAQTLMGNLLSDAKGTWGVTNKQRAAIGEALAGALERVNAKIRMAEKP